jgi:very-short-patch-repair endonuclease
VVAKVCVSGTREEKVAAIAARQRGRVSRDQLLAAGLSYGVIQRLIKRGFLHPIHGSVYAVGHNGAVELGAETAALLAMRDGALLSGLSAARVWDLRLPTPGAVEVLVGGSHSAGRPGIVVHRTRVLTPRDRRVHKGLPVTSPARVLLDVADEVTDRELERAFDGGLVERTMRRDDVAELLGRARGHAGAAALRALLNRSRGTTVTRSDAEERFLALIREAGLPEPEVNVMVAGFEVDFFWRAQGLVVEVDSFGFHSTQRRFERDHRKEAAVRTAGFELLRFTYWQIESEPLVVVAGVARRV